MLDPTRRALFVAGYARLVTEVWSDPDAERLLQANPRALLSRHDLDLPSEVDVDVRRDTDGAEPSLDEQVRLWEEGHATGTVVLIVPDAPPLTTGELSDAELAGVVGGMDVMCSCCCPCCCSG